MEPNASAGAAQTVASSAESSTTTAAATPQPKLFKVYGREFDIATEEGFKQAQTWSEAMSTFVGKQSTEIGTLRQEVEPLRKYNLKGATVDEVEALKKVETLRAAGDDASADKLMFELYRQAQKSASSLVERERLWADYKSARPDVFSVLPDDMAKSYVFANYQSEIEDSEDPFALIDRILKPKAAKLTPASSSQQSEPPAVLGAGKPAPAPAPKPEPETGKVWDATLKELGF